MKNVKLKYLIGLAAFTILVVVLALLMPNINVHTETKYQTDSKVHSADIAVSTPTPTQSHDMMTISICSNPAFPSGQEEGYINIVNEKQNKHPQQVKIYLATDNSIIYESDMIPVGYAISYDKLDVSLPKGDYPCTAMFYEIEGDTVVGQAGAEILISVLN